MVVHLLAVWVLADGGDWGLAAVLADFDVDNGTTAEHIGVASWVVQRLKLDVTLFYVLFTESWSLKDIIAYKL